MIRLHSPQIRSRRLRPFRPLEVPDLRRRIEAGRRRRERIEALVPLQISLCILLAGSLFASFFHAGVAMASLGFILSGIAALGGLRNLANPGGRRVPSPRLMS